MNSPLASLLDLTPTSRESSSVVDILSSKYGESNPTLRAVAVALSVGMTTAEISIELGLAESEVHNIASQPACQARLRRLLTTVDPIRLGGIMKAAAVDAVVEIRKLMHDPNPNIRFSACKYTLDRALGNAAPPRSATLSDTDNPTEQLEKIKQEIAEKKKSLQGKL